MFGLFAVLLPRQHIFQAMYGPSRTHTQHATPILDKYTCAPLASWAYPDDNMRSVSHSHLPYCFLPFQPHVKTTPVLVVWVAECNLLVHMFLHMHDRQSGQSQSMSCYKPKQPAPNLMTPCTSQMYFKIKWPEQTKGTTFQN